jgi:hypothetical protein
VSHLHWLHSGCEGMAGCTLLCKTGITMSHNQL